MNRRLFVSFGSQHGTSRLFEKAALYGIDTAGTYGFGSCPIGDMVLPSVVLIICKPAFAMRRITKLSMFRDAVLPPGTRITAALKLDQSPFLSRCCFNRLPIELVSPA
mmetsp:Transcript_36393/g.55921  ORF Transcript_36393/g.55921 Transcript_36393/m.55921 type:complete len:108 (-) Transcript_36393:97-420(-)